MGNILNPGNLDFKNKSLLKTPKFYVDKTEFITHININIQTDDKFICFTRPRRFGKTITAKMLSAYYSKGCDSKEIFDRFKVASDLSYIEHINKYNVIYIDMNMIFENFNCFDKTERVQDIVEYLRYSIVKDLRTVKEFDNVLNHNSEINEINVALAISEIYRQTKEKFVFIMDEWDLIYREYRDNGPLQKKFINLLRGLFKSDCQSAFALVYMTGILPIKKYNSESALNNFREFNMLQPEPYEKFFGFTEEETEQIAKDHGNKPTFKELKEWYDGYKLNDVSILNPNSVACAVNSGKCRTYWTQTAAFAPLIHLIDMNLDGFKEELLKILAGEKVAFDASTFQNDMVSIGNKDDAFCLLVCLGYLACVNKPYSNTDYLAYVPNLEISSVLRKIVTKQDWFPQMELVKRSEELYKATIAMDGNRVAEIMDDIHNGPHVSAITYNSEAALSYCVLFGYSWTLLNTYNTFRDLDAGKGFVDIAYIPLESNNPVLIIELKYDVSANAALKQIRSKNYAKDLASRYPKVLLVAINYDSKTKAHACSIEEY